MKKQMNIGRKVMTINTVLAFVTLGVFIFSFLFFNIMTTWQSKEYSDNILETVSSSLSRETQRLSVLATQAGMDGSVLLALSNKLGIEKFIDVSQEVSGKLGIMQYSLPYAQNVYAYVNSNEKVISLSNSVLSREAFVSNIQPYLSVGETLPDLDSMKSGYYSYNSFALYVSNVLNCGSIIIKIDPARFCDFEILSATLPTYDLIVLDQSRHIFASTNKDLNKILEQLDLSASKPQHINYNGALLEITVKNAVSSGFQLLLINHGSKLNRQQYAVNMVVILAGIVIFVTCALTVLFNKRIYIPLRSICRLYGEPSAQNEIDAIRKRFDELIRENSKMTEQIQFQKDIQTDIALSCAVYTPDGITGATQELLQSQYGRYWMAVVAAQTEDGGNGRFFERLDSHLLEVLECRIMHIDEFCHAYIISANKSAREGREALLGAMEGYADSGEMMFVSGASDFYDSVADLQKAFRQAWSRMLLNPVPKKKDCLLCMTDPIAANQPARTISLEVQNTVAGYILSGNATEIENILQNILYDDSEATLGDFISLYKALGSLVRIVISSSGISIPLGEFETQQSKQPVYNPDYMFSCILRDCKRLNEACACGQSALRYKITEYLHRHYCEALSLESIAADFGITPVYLSTYFKKNVGINFSVYLSNMRMERAKNLLLENPLIKLSDLAARIGIPNVPTFSRQFKRYTGATPDQYRKMNFLKEDILE